MPRKQGVYQISNTLTGDTYIGSSVDIARRWADHRRIALVEQLTLSTTDTV